MGSGSSSPESENKRATVKSARPNMRKGLQFKYYVQRLFIKAGFNIKNRAIGQLVDGGLRLLG